MEFYAPTADLSNQETSNDYQGMEIVDGFMCTVGEFIPYSGIAFSYWPDGQMKKKAHFVDGEYDGKMTWWYQNGQKELENEFVASELHGKHETWYPNGAKMCLGKRKKGQQEGVWRWWYEDGQIKEENRYLYGQGQGKCAYWYPNGSKKNETVYVAGEKTGAHKEWYENGKRNIVVGYYEDELHGTAKVWDEKGGLVSEQNYVHGELLLDTTIKFKYDDCINREKAVRGKIKKYLSEAFESFDSKGVSADFSGTINAMISHALELAEDDSVEFPIKHDSLKLIGFEFERQSGAEDDSDNSRLNEIIEFKYEDCLNHEETVREKINKYIKGAFKTYAKKGVSADYSGTIDTMIIHALELDEDDSVEIPISHEGKRLIVFEFMRQ